MQVERSLARELLIKHELARTLRISMQFVNEDSRFLATGSNQRVQFASQFFFTTRGCLDVSVDNDGSFGH